MQRVLVESNTRQQLMPCTPARARMLLTEKKAAVLNRYPFTIVLKDRADGDTQLIEFKTDPGSKLTGVALVAEYAKRGKTVVFAVEIHHRGQAIKKSLDSRRSIRRSRRNRKTRYRAPRFDNRTRPEGWLPPSLMSRVYNTMTLAQRLQRLAPLTSVAVETVRFDMQKMVNPEISGVEYQQGTLAGFEVKQYLLQKWGHKCAYCGTDNVPLQIEHIIPASRVLLIVSQTSLCPVRTAIRERTTLVLWSLGIRRCRNKLLCRSKTRQRLTLPDMRLAIL